MSQGSFEAFLFIESIFNLSKKNSSITASDVAYIGLRSVDKLEKGILGKLNITTYSMRDIDRLGIVEVTRRAIKKISPNGKPLHVSLDIDVLDDLEIGENTGTPGE